VADNVAVADPAVPYVVTSDQLPDASHVQIVKLAVSAADDGTRIPATVANGMLVDVSRVSGTVTTQATGTTTVAGTVAISGTPTVTVSGTVLIDDAASLAVTGPATNTELRLTPLPVTAVITGSPAVTTGGLTDTQLRATPVPVSGTVAATVSGTVTATGPLTDTQLRAAAVPVSGPLTDTQLRAAVVPVTAVITGSPAVTTGGLTDTQLRATPVFVSPTGRMAARVTGVATSAIPNTVVVGPFQPRGQSMILNVEATTGSPLPVMTLQIGPTNAGPWRPLAGAYYLDTLTGQAAAYYSAVQGAVMVGYPVLAEWARVVISTSGGAGSVSDISVWDTPLAMAAQVLARTDMTPAATSGDAGINMFSGILQAAGLVHNPGGTWDRARSAAASGEGLGRLKIANGTGTATLLNAVVANTTGAATVLGSAYSTHTVVFVSTGAPTGGTVALEGSLDGTTWYGLTSNAVTAAGTIVAQAIDKPATQIRATLVGLVGTIALTAKYAGV
jgi:hypothetical protein